MGAIKQYCIELAENLEQKMVKGNAFALDEWLGEFTNAYASDYLDNDFLPEEDEITVYDIAFYCVISGAYFDSTEVECFLKENGYDDVSMYGNLRRVKHA